MPKVNEDGSCCNQTVLARCSGCPYGSNSVEAYPLPTGAATPPPAVKYDLDKVRADLLPSAPLLAIAKVLTFGAKKYADHNWRGGFEASRLIGAALRHLLAYNDGEDKDPESGISHLAHAGCCIMFLLEQEAKGTGTDDRYKRA